MRRRGPMACLLWGALSVPAVLAAPAASAAPEATRGEQIYARCLACHALAFDRVGPRHCGLLGRKAGSVAGFAYTPAMKASRLVWNAETLDRFLENPMRVVPGTAMTYAGVPDKQDRADLIAYLAAADASAECARAGP